ncbi:MAG: hypothetical protein WKF92_09795 [Pyrinomonadaceae bacterium]
MLKPRLIAFVAYGLILFSAHGSYGQSNREPALVVNGIPIEGGVKTIDGKVYVDISATAKALNITIRKSPSVLILESATKQGGSAEGTGSLVGNLSYYFNKNYGNKPDVGSKVFVIDGSSAFNPTKEQMFISVGDKLVLSIDKVFTNFPILFRTSADDNGRFEIKGVPPGKYIMQSSRSKAVNSLEVLGKVLVKTIDVGPGSNVDLSHDFGITAY